MHFRSHIKQSPKAPRLQTFKTKPTDTIPHIHQTPNPQKTNHQNPPHTFSKSKTPTIHRNAHSALAPFRPRVSTDDAIPTSARREKNNSKANKYVYVCFFVRSDSSGHSRWRSARGTANRRRRYTRRVRPLATLTNLRAYLCVKMIYVGAYANER